MRMRPNLVAMDIETTGLKPESCKVVAIGLASSERVEPNISSDERALLSWVENEILPRPA